MRFVGIDLGGINSLASVRDSATGDALCPSVLPERPSCIILPIAKKAEMVAGDAALRSEREIGLAWPPLAMVLGQLGGFGDCGGRLLLATVWDRLIDGGEWEPPRRTWQPPGELPAVAKPPPASCLEKEFAAVLDRLPRGGGESFAVLAIPNQLPEESQDQVLRRLPVGSRLIWRSVAAAMSWADKNGASISEATCLAVVDVGLTSVEVSRFQFRRKQAAEHVFNVPIRRDTGMKFIRTGPLYEFGGTMFQRLTPDSQNLMCHLSQISDAVGPQAELLICGPMAELLVNVLGQSYPQRQWPSPDHSAIARGASLFAARLSSGLPTYLDVLPSLDLFTLTEEHEPRWLSLVPSNQEVAGGELFRRPLSRPIFIQRGTIRLASWLRRAGENEFRNVTTDLPIEARNDAWVDIEISAESAGGLAQVRLVPARGQFEVFGPGQSLLLNWLSMKRVPRGSWEWPVEIKYGWPECGGLFAWQSFFDEFLHAATDVESLMTMQGRQERAAYLDRLKYTARKTIAPHLAGVGAIAGNAAPMNLLVCFSSNEPCAFMATTGPRTLSASSRGHQRAAQIAQCLWERLESVVSRGSPQSEIDSLVFLLGRMGGYAPTSFQNYLAEKIGPRARPIMLFAAGRVLQTPVHGCRVFAAVHARAAVGEALNLNWLRMLVYVLYQRPDFLKDVPEVHLLTTARCCVAVFKEQLENGNFRVLFNNSLRLLALLLRARRFAPHRGFLSVGKEEEIAQRIADSLKAADTSRIPAAARKLTILVRDWLSFAALTGVMPPIAPADEEGDDE